MKIKMHARTRGRVLVLWMCTLTLVKSQDCTLEQFTKSSLYDSNFDMTGLLRTYVSGKQVRVNCNIGFSGFFKLICVQGTWTSKGTKCQPTSCGHPGDAQFADFNLEKGDDFVFGSQVVYTCHKGYQMVSRTNIRHCMAHGWDGVVPVCEPQQCPVIHVGNNVHVHGDPEDATYGNVVRFSCKSNSEIMTGSPEMYCDENGEWSGEVPKCIAIKCDAPEIENGYVLGDTQEYNEHEVLHFGCNQKYKRAEDRPSKCTKLGIRAEWSPTPVCEERKCRLTLPPLEGTRYEPGFRNLFSPGETLRVICGERFWISNHRNTLAVTTCKDDGEWTVRPVCQEVICSNRRQPNVYHWSVYWNQQLTLGRTVSYSCNQGYKNTDRATVATCTRDEWSPKPLCTEITCARRDYPDADITTNNKEIYKYYEYASYVCKEGYQGSFTLTCLESGWRGQPQCTSIMCNTPYYQNAVINGTALSQYKYNEQLEFVCKTGYEGRFTVTCKERGWTGSRQCTKRQECKRLDIDGAYIYRNDQRSYSDRDTVQYVCTNDGDRRFTVTCYQGVWTGIESCTKCPEAKVPHGFVVGPYNNTVYFTCNEGYKLYTKSWWGEAKCINGVWSEFEECIERTQCGETPVVPNGVVSHPNKVYSQHGTVHISCNEGYRAQTDHLTCLKGKWDSNGLSFKAICTSTANHCGPPPKAENAVVMTSYQKEYLSNSKVTYLCRNKYTMEGDGIIQCKNGKWEKKNITCAPYYCHKLKDPTQSMKFTADKLRYDNDEVIKYQCMTPDGQITTEGNATCVNGKWIKSVECEAAAGDKNTGIFHRKQSLSEEFTSDRDVVTVTLLVKMRLLLILLFLQLWGNVDAVLQSECSKLPDVPNTHLSEETKRAEYDLGHVIHFTCEIGYVGPTIRYLCSSDGWFRLHVGTCYLKPCALPDDTSNGYYQIIHGEDFVFGATIKYFCDEGYHMVSKTDTRTCYVDGWTNHVPICDPWSCEPPPVDGSITVKGIPGNDEPILPDRFLRFSCDDPGKYLNGSSMLVCGKDGQWDNPVPSCEDITCTVDKNPPHLYVADLPPAHETIKIGHKLRFSCNDDYELDGVGEIECLQTGEWSAPFPTCSARCKIPVVPNNVHSIPNVRGNLLRKGQILRFACRYHGEVLRGKAAVECLAEGQWSDPFPTCGGPLGCGRPPPLADGDLKNTLKYQHRHGEAVEYICQNYYTMDGQPYRVCDNGEWTGRMRCLKPCTVDKEAMSKSNIRLMYSYNDKIYSAHNDIITFACTGHTRHDYVLPMRQRCVDGVIHLPRCQSCSKPPDVLHAQVSEGTRKAEYQEGDVIHFTCEPGYISSQTAMYLCTGESWLSVRPGTCYTCSRLPDVTHAHITEETKRAEYQEGNMIHFTCEPGYTSGAIIKYVCTSEGWVSVRRGRCYSLGCDPPPADGGVTVKGLPENDFPITPDHTITFSCDSPGKYLNGNSVLICGENGQWDNPFPSCEARCKIPVVPNNVHSTPNVRGNLLRKGQILRFACRYHGEVLRGKAAVECLAEGQWSDPFPTCGEPLGCGRPPPLADGDIKNTLKYQYRHGEAVEYICQSYYTMDGQPYRVCDNGEWTGRMRCLKPCTMDKEAMSRSNIRLMYSYNDKIYSAHNDMITFACTGHTRHDYVLPMRQRCVDGVIHLPRCQ
ncbi:complement factor H-like [Pempheris klunzingeri]|uniref:complement factor H-like n=1 Tax=Pempheris klunzingeri TaxID=3127111 RepID=UPI00397EA281